MKNTSWRIKNGAGTVKDKEYSNGTSEKKNVLIKDTTCTTGKINRTMIDGLQRQSNNMEKKLDWVFYTLVTTLIAVMINLIAVIGVVT